MNQGSIKVCIESKGSEKIQSPIQISSTICYRNIIELKRKNQNDLPTETPILFQNKYRKNPTTNYYGRCGKKRILNKSCVGRKTY